MICRSAQVLNLRFDEVVARFANASGVGLDGVTGPKSPGLKAGAAMACRSLSFSTGRHPQQLVLELCLVL